MNVTAIMAAGLIAFATMAHAHDQHGDPNWIANGNFVSQIDGSRCCGLSDCDELPADDVRQTGSGFYLHKRDETVPFRESQVSQDGSFWRCRKPDGSRRCFFAPLPSIM